MKVAINWITICSRKSIYNQKKAPKGRIVRNTASSNSVNLAPLVHILVSAVNSCFYCKSHYVLGSRLELRSQVQILEILLFLKTKFLISITAKKINMTQMNHSSMRKIIMCLYLGLCSYNLESWHVSFVLQSYSKRVFMSLLFFFFFDLEWIKELQCYSSNLVSDT